MIDRQFWRGKSIFLTGHTGFKGGWLSTWLLEMESNVYGYALAPNTTPSFYELTRLDDRLHSTIGDVRDLERLRRCVEDAKPEILFHLAAQPLVRRSYAQPLETFTINVIGTANVLEVARHVPSIKAIVVVTTDKCYAEAASSNGYRETDRIGGRDPYSASKACAELVAQSYRHSYYENGAAPVAMATARAGNVIGGGDWSEDRIVADAVRAFSSGHPLRVRNPSSVRPWQHVMEPLAGYLMLAERLYRDGSDFAGAWNFGPSDMEKVSVSRLADCLTRAWGDDARWEPQLSEGQVREANVLRLDSSKARQHLAWRSRLSFDDSVRLAIEWYRRALSPSRANMYRETCTQIRAYHDHMTDTRLGLPPEPVRE